MKAIKINKDFHTSFDTASITKLFTAAGIVLLESKGKINFEDNIHSIVNLSGTRIPKDDITFSILGNVECNIWELQSKAEKILFA